MIERIGPIGPTPSTIESTEWPMVGADAARNARRMRRSERRALDEIRAYLARLGQPVDDLTSDELRARAIKLIGRERRALEAVARALAAPPDDDD
jgi:hypothetical protein